jgi:hypothetical protein
MQNRLVIVAAAVVVGPVPQDVPRSPQQSGKRPVGSPLTAPRPRHGPSSVTK